MGYVTQEVINLVLSGIACSKVFDGERVLGDDLKLKGIPKKSEIGFLSGFEAYNYIEVGDNYKRP